MSSSAPTSQTLLALPNSGTSSGAHATAPQTLSGGEMAVGGIPDRADPRLLLDRSGDSSISSTQSQLSPPLTVRTSLPRSQYSPHGIARAMAHTLRRAIAPASTTKKSRATTAAASNGTTSAASSIPSPETSFSSVSTQSSIGTGSGSPESSTSSSQSSTGLRSPVSAEARLPQPTTTSWSLQSILGLSTKRKTPTSLSFSSRSSSIRTKNPGTDDPQHQKAIDALVAKYMHMPDLLQSGNIDASRVRRGRLGLGPKRQEKCDLYYEVFGTGTRKLFLIMGMVGCTMYWRLQTRYFAELGDYTVCVFDNCGSGRSTISAGPYKVTQLAKDACLVLDHLGWSQDIHMVGVSLGGMIAQEMCLMNSGIVFASVAFVDTWHSSTMALPTTKEVRFAFKGMSALGSNPKHLIDLVFSRRWANTVFHDTLKPIQSSPDSVKSALDAHHPTNRDVMTALFRVIQMDLNEYRERSEEAPPPVGFLPKGIPAVASVMPLPARHKATTELACTGSPFDANKGDDSAPVDSTTLHHSRSLAVMTTSTARPKQDRPVDSRRPPKGPEDTGGSRLKREVSGDLHQFMACLGHTLSAARVKSIRTLNPHTRFLVIHGSKDRVIRPACGSTLAKLLACPMVVIQDAGHMPLIDAHCTFNLVVRAFTRDERWMSMVPEDRFDIVPPASWDEQVRVRNWILDSDRASKGIALDVECNGSLQSELPPLLEIPSPVSSGGRLRRVSGIGQMLATGPISRQLLVVDESDPEVAGRIIPANCELSTGIASPAISIARQKSITTTTSNSNTSLKPPTRELVIYGTLMDKPLRIRRYK